MRREIRYLILATDGRWYDGYKSLRMARGCMVRGDILYQVTTNYKKLERKGK